MFVWRLFDDGKFTDLLCDKVERRWAQTRKHIGWELARQSGLVERFCRLSDMRLSLYLLIFSEICVFTGSACANMEARSVYVLLLLGNIFAILSVSAVPKKKEVFCYSVLKRITLNSNLNANNCQYFSRLSYIPVPTVAGSLYHHHHHHHHREDGSRPWEASVSEK